MSTHKTIRVPVTQEHIDNGCPGSPERCALALALKDSGLPASVGVLLAIFDARKGFAAALPDEARRFRVRFDLRKPVAPFDFEISVPKAVLAEAVSA